MSKKLIPLLIILVCCGFAFSNESKYCPFCDPKVLAAQTFYEDDLVLALYTHKPILPGHCLIIPKKHIERFENLSDAEALQVTQVIKKVNRAVEKVFGTSSYLLLQKNGYEVGQTVPHIHFHYIPRKAGDDSVLKFLFLMYWKNMQKPMPYKEMQGAIENLREAMSECSLYNF